MKAIRALASLGVVAASLALSPLAPGAAALPGEECPDYGAELTIAEAPEGVDTVACDLHGVALIDPEMGGGVTIPSPGEGTLLHMEGDGPGFLGIEVEADGTLTYLHPEDSSGSGSGGSEIDACTDELYDTGPRKRFTNYSWYINASNLPGAYTQSNVVDAIKSGASHWPQVDNSCGLSDTVSIQQVYQGITNVQPDMTTSGGSFVCLAADATSTVGFMNAPAVGSTAAACVDTVSANDPTGQYPFITKKIVTTDIMFNTSFGWTTNIPSGCTVTRDWESTATHEMGHAFGLFDIPGSTHGKLTMYGSGVPCTIFKRSLAKGDVLGFKHLYD